MRLDHAMRVVSLLATAILSPVSVDRQARNVSRIDRIEPAAVRAGAYVTALGVNLNRSRVVDLILSGADTVSLARIVEQQDTIIRFRVPGSIAAGRYRIVLVVSSGWGMELIDQDLSIDILERETALSSIAG